MIHTFRPRTLFDRNFPSNKPTKSRYLLMKSESTQYFKIKLKQLLWTALKRPLHTICQEGCTVRKLPQRGAREHSSQPAMKGGTKMQQHTEAIFPPSTGKGCSILSIRNPPNKYKIFKTVCPYILFKRKAYVFINATVGVCSYSHGKGCCKIMPSIIDYVRCQAINTVFR